MQGVYNRLKLKVAKNVSAGFGVIGSGCSLTPNSLDTGNRL